MRSRLAQGLAMVVIVILGAAQGPASSWSPNNKAQVPAVTVPVTRPTHPYQVGTASWYGDYFEGKPTASGEPYNMYELTAAHPTLPLGTLVKVTNLRNHRTVVVRINDRGPIVPGRIIDVSYGAAKTLRFQNRGIQRVRLDVIPARKPATTMALLREPALPL
jgi:rare lipoprotein A